ncbi:MAG: HD domain-containing protein [Desulfosalsimonadaceae bacterium]
MHNFNLNFIPPRKGVYIVGGSVRDALRGYPPKDYDIAVTENAREIAETIGRRVGSRVIEIGKPGKRIYRVIAGADTYDISPAKGPTVTEDLALRDFTINAIAYDVFDKKLIDPVKGLSDIDKGIVRMVCPAAFRSDPLRLLRAFRIAAALDFDISPDTLNEIKNNAAAIKTVAGERIREEWIKLLGAAGSFGHIRKMEETGLLAAILPELTPLKECPRNAHHAFNAFEHSLSVYRHLENMLDLDTPRLSDRCRNTELIHAAAGIGLIKHAALVHDIGKPRTYSVDESGKTHFYGHETTGSAISRDISKRLCFSTVQKNYVSSLILHHLRPMFLFTAMSAGRNKNLAKARFFMRTAPFTPDLLLLFTADMMGKGTKLDVSGIVSFARETISACFDSFYPETQNPPLITGHDLIFRFGLPPSPLIAEILDKIELQRLSGNITTREKALTFADNYLKTKNPS